MSETSKASRDETRRIIHARIRNDTWPSDWPLTPTWLLSLVDDADRCAKLERIGRKVIRSGVLCEIGCCGDDCGCAELRMALGD